MARSLRIEYPGAFYHIIQRGIERKSIFASDKDKEKILSYFDSARLSYGALFHAYLLMDNHYHIILETPEANLSKTMHYLNTSYAVYFNTKQKRIGPLFQGRFKAILVQQDEYLHYLSRYIHLNPVRADIVKFPGEYPFSSYRYFTLDLKPPQWLNTTFILSTFNKSLAKAKRLYRQFVVEGIGREKDIIKENTRKGIVLGNEDFFEHLRTKFIDKEDPEIPLLKELKHRKEPPLGDIRAIVEKNIKTDKRLKRSIAIYLSRKYTQKTLNQIASFYGKITYPGVSQVYRRITQRRVENEQLNRLLVKLETEIINCQV